MSQAEIERPMCARPCGKSHALSQLSAHLPTGTIPDFTAVTLTDWRANPAAFIAECVQRFRGQKGMAVRSDAHAEDGLLASSAGVYPTILNVEACGLAQAIEHVADALPGHAGDKIMVQAMVWPIEHAGVASTHRVSDGAPWYCVEMASGDSAAVTSGRANGRQIAVSRVAAGGEIGAGPLSEPLSRVLWLLRVVEAVFENLPLEIEFALGQMQNGDRGLFLLQARPIAARQRWPVLNTSVDFRLPPLDMLQQLDPHPDVAGQRTVLSMMSDWNPAELLGSHPRPLALSLFQALISRGVWWRGRGSLGYVDAPVPDIGLLQVLCGRPLVDARRSANSLVPKGLPASLRGALVDNWIARLCAQPELHDKVEFQIFRTARDFTAPTELRREGQDGLTERDRLQWETALGQLTRSMMLPGEHAPLQTRCAAIDRLRELPATPRSWLQWLSLAQQGTLAFAALARIAFAADAQLRSAICRGALAPERAAALRLAGRSAPIWHPTTAGQAELDEGHGHLRPGTFDITQMTWAASDFKPRVRINDPAPTFSFSAGESRAMRQLLREAELPLDPDGWLQWIQKSRQTREWSKHVFSRYLSAAMDGIAASAAGCGLDRETASWLTVEQLSEGSKAERGQRRLQWLRAAEQAKEEHEHDQRVIVGPVLRHSADRWVADSLGVLPNFVGRVVIGGPLVVLDDHRARNEAQLRNAIVAIRQADPGFDWLFDCGIAGLITAWGGANSHMAVRCAEFGVSAAIGCGEAVFGRATRARQVRIDPLGGALWLT